jgi:8-oxo-dGTP pyrophosphatase MutT (NUDIX family)/catechol 2,3-dioxygenase-like lactoylglutathione lyase family enzyme
LAAAVSSGHGGAEYRRDSIMTIERVQRVAAYCVIYDNEGRLLLTGLAENIKAGRWWTLPGGGIEFGEHPDDAAIREVKEETGYDVVLDGLLMADSTSGQLGHDHLSERPFHALRYIYRAHIVGGTLGVLDVGGSTTEAAWFTQSELTDLNLVEEVKLVVRRTGSPARGASRLRSIDHVQLAIPPGGEDEARAFWVGVMGLVEDPKPPLMAARGGAWFSSLDRVVTVHVGVAPQEVGAQKSHPAFIVNDLDELAHLLIAEGYSVRWDSDNPGVRRFHTDDPFGNRIELIDSHGT